MKLFIFTLLIAFSVINSAELPCKCRLGNRNRIINGQIAPTNFVPWMASFSFFNIHLCGGTILNEKYILTAAHCVKYKILKWFYYVRVGIHDTKNTTVGQKYRIKNIFNLDHKNPGEFGDFALLELKEPIKFIPGKIEPACLNLEDKFFDGDILSVGWGDTISPWKKIEDQKSKPKRKPKETTLLKYYYSTQYTDNCEDFNICISAKNNNDSACFGDSGSPLMHTKNGRTSVIGIASFVKAKIENSIIHTCGGRVAYARLSMYKEYIDKFVINYCSS